MYKIEISCGSHKTKITDIMLGELGNTKICLKIPKKKLMTSEIQIKFFKILDDR